MLKKFGKFVVILALGYVVSITTIVVAVIFDVSPTYQPSMDVIISIILFGVSVFVYLSYKIIKM